MTRSGWLALLGSAVAVLAALVLAPPGWIAHADARLDGWRVWLGILRAAAIAAAWVWWNALVGAIPGLSADGAAYVKSRRVFWIGALAAVELVLVRNVPGALWALA